MGILYHTLIFPGSGGDAGTIHLGSPIGANFSPGSAQITMKPKLTCWTIADFHLGHEDMHQHTGQDTTVEKLKSLAVTF